MYRHRSYYTASLKSIARSNLIISAHSKKSKPLVQHDDLAPKGKAAKINDVMTHLIEIFQIYSITSTITAIEKEKDKIREGLDPGEEVLVTMKTDGDKVEVVSVIDKKEPIISSRTPPSNQVTVTVEKPKEFKEKEDLGYNEKWKENFKQETGLEAEYLDADTEFDFFGRGGRMC